MSNFFTINREEMIWAGKKLTLETGRIARQADGAVLVTYGETTLLCTVAFEKKAKEGIDFFPLSVHYQEKAFAAGRIPGGFVKRETKPSERETLISRLIDRPIRPLFPENFNHETQVICTLLSYDQDVETDIPAIIGASAALAIAGIPFAGPVGGARVGFKDGQYLLNPNRKEIAQSALDLVVAGTAEGVLMVESEANELSEEIMLGAVTFGHQQYQDIISMISRLAAKASKEKYREAEVPATFTAIKKAVEKEALSLLNDAYTIAHKQTRYQALDKIKEDVCTKYTEEEQHLALKAFEDLKYHVMRSLILKDGKRVDGRGLENIRPIVCETGLLPKVHGSALFTRGETQSICVVTLGSGQDEQIVDTIEGLTYEHFMLHYNFPPYSVGEVGRMGAPGRREIGHGRLAWRAIHPILPKKADFGYAIRVVSEITESNGSSSMATVCGTSLALMDAGVPLPKPIAGIAMGLIKEKDQYAVLSDILGDEDHLGDMDFKVAGTADGITALQMDIKITSITPEIMEKALHQAKAGRMHILEQMAKAISQPRAKLSEYAPRIEQIRISKDKIRDVIGSGGKVIREICETTNSKIDISEDGVVTIAAANGSDLEKAITIIKGIVVEPEIGTIYDGVVTKILDFGAIVSFLGSREGMVHISEIAPTRINAVSDVLSVGQSVRVKLIALEDRGKVRLSIKQALPA